MSYALSAYILFNSILSGNYSMKTIMLKTHDHSENYFTVNHRILNVGSWLFCSIESCVV